MRFIIGFEVRRQDLGIPERWSEISSWFQGEINTNKSLEPIVYSVTKKCVEIPKLTDYHSAPLESFWKGFPSNVDLSAGKTPVNVKKFEEYIDSCSPKWSRSMKKIASSAIKTLKQGSSSNFRFNPTPVMVSNAESAFKYGEMITDAIATWIKKGFVLGPFSEPPIQGLCVSPLMASRQKTKIRPILNLSAPAGSSVNDAMNADSFRKLTMSSAKMFGKTVLDA